MPRVSSPSCMMTPESDVDSPLAISSCVDGNNARVIIRHLLDRFGREEINRLLEEEAPSSSSQIGRISLPDTASSHHVQRNSLASQTVALNHRGASYPMQAPNATLPIFSNPSSQRSQRQSNSDQGPAVPSAAQKPDYACGLCAEENIRKTCTRRNDLRRHIENFHNKNAIWFCQHPGCNMAYDWQSAYQTHLRTAHGRSHMNVDEAMIKVCPQTVFACGFENCTTVFESSSEEDAAATLKGYSSHVVKHFEEGSNGGRWSYSTRLRNLLRQSKVSVLWEKAWPEMERPALQWDTQTSMAARKTLEAGHLENLPFLIRLMISLGSDGGDLGKLGGRLEPPVKERCPAPYRHRLLLVDTQAHSPQQHGSERDMKQFTVSGDIGLDYSTGLGPGPGVGAYVTMQPAPQALRSVEDSRSLTPPQLFYHDSSSTMFSHQPPAIFPAALRAPQHSAGQIVAAVTQESQEPDSVVNPVGFNDMQPVPTHLASGMDVDMTGGAIHNYNHAGMGHYSHMALQASSLSTGAYHLSSTATPEHDDLLGHFGSPEEPIQ